MISFSFTFTCGPPYYHFICHSTYYSDKRKSVLQSSSFKGIKNLICTMHLLLHWFSYETTMLQNIIYKILQSMTIPITSCYFFINYHNKEGRELTFINMYINLNWDYSFFPSWWSLLLQEFTILAVSKSVWSET